MQKDVRVCIDQPRQKRHPRQLDRRRAWRDRDVRRGPGRRDPVARHEDDPAFMCRRADAVEHPLWAEEHTLLGGDDR